MNSNEYVSGTDVRNFMLNDTLVDWLKLYFKKDYKETETDFVKHILQKGNDFESKIINTINSMIKVVSVSSIFSDENVLQTLKLMKEGIPLIHSAPIKNEKLKLKGIADLLIRNDYLNQFVNYEYKHSCNQPYHYVVLDIKWSTLKLTADQTHLVNSGNIPAYKGQINIYNKCLFEMQNYEPKIGLILGRRSSCDSKDIKYDSPFEKVGIINFENKDNKYEHMTTQAINWIRKVRKEGNNWSVNPPSNSFLYPNMKIDSGQWNDIKNKIAREIGEISLIWYCGLKQRQHAFDKGIFTFKDERCSTDLLKMNSSSKRTELVSNILKINQQKEIKLRSCIKNTSIPERSNEMFVDFETFCDIHDFDDTDDNEEDFHRLNTIFLIGALYQDQYYSFIAKDLNINSEFEIMEQFVSFVNKCGNPTLWYWHAEAQLWDRSYQNHFDLKCFKMKNEKDFYKTEEMADWNNLNWKDLKDVFISNQIVIQNCFSYKLKEIVECLSTHGFISSYILSECKNGKDASLLALNLYLKTDNVTHVSRVMKDIIKYNEFDVTSLFKILTFLRNFFKF